jgi:cytochrome c5
MSEENSSLIKTPRQLVLVVALSFLIPVMILVTIAYLVTSGGIISKDSTAMSEEAIAQRLQPVGQVVIADAASAGQTDRTGKQVFDAVCAACHASGALGAPKIGDKAAWGKLITQGLDKLSGLAISGIRNMPPRGGNPSLSDIEVTRAVAFMANEAGANFKEPPAKPAAAKPKAEAPAAAAATAPAAKSEIAAKPAAKADGKATYEKACAACHATGVAGAPKAGDKGAWAPRIQSGANALYTSALKGKGAMPPKGGNASLSDDEVKAAVDYLASLAK